MAKQASIPITDHADPGVCTSFYRVQYRPSGAPFFNETANQYTTPVLIENLDASTDYEYQVTRYCCGGLVSTPVSGTFTTSA